MLLEVRDHISNLWGECLEMSHKWTSLILPLVEFPTSLNCMESKGRFPWALYRKKSAYSITRTCSVATGAS